MYNCLQLPDSLVIIAHNRFKGGVKFYPKKCEIVAVVEAKFFYICGFRGYLSEDVNIGFVFIYFEARPVVEFVETVQCMLDVCFCFLWV